MKSREFSALVGWPYAKLMRVVGTIPGAVKMKDAQGRPYWEIPEAAAAAPPFQLNPAEASPGELNPSDPPTDPEPIPPPPPPTDPEPLTPGQPSYLPLLALVILLAALIVAMARPRTPRELPLYY